MGNETEYNQISSTKKEAFGKNSILKLSKT